MDNEEILNTIKIQAISINEAIVNEKKERVLILGITGMLGHTLFLEMSKNKNLEVYGTARTIDFEKSPFFK